jgi:hypothetical protein
MHTNISNGALYEKKNMSLWQNLFSNPNQDIQTTGEVVET